MGLSRNPDVIRLSKEDPNYDFLINKVRPGQGIKFNLTQSPYGHQVAICAVNEASGALGDVFTVEGAASVPNTASMVLVDASAMEAIVTLPHPAECNNWLAVVALDVTNPITLTTANELDKIDIDGNDTKTSIVKKEGIQFMSAGDAYIFASDRQSRWFPISRYTTDWYA